MSVAAGVGACWPPRPPDNIKQVESEGESVEREVEEAVTVERVDGGDLSEDSSRVDEDEVGSADGMVEEEELEELLPAVGEVGGRDGGEHVVEKGPRGQVIIREGQHYFVLECRAWNLMKQLRPGIELSDLRSIALCMLKVADKSYSIEMSNQYGREVFREAGLVGIPKAMVDQGDEELRQAGSLEQLATNRRRAMSDMRLSRERVQTVTAAVRADIAAGVAMKKQSLRLSSDEEFLRDVERLSLIGDEGVRIFTDSKFVPSAVRGRKPAQYIEAPDAINAHIFKGVAQGLGLLVSWEMFLMLIDAHLQNFGFAKMYGKPKGRLTSNCSGVSAVKPRGGAAPTPLNTDEVKAAAEELYGRIHHPTIVDLIRMILRAQARHGVGNIYIAKEDLRGY